MDVYIPNSNLTKTDRAILFWIHGGGFVGGDSSFYSGIEQAVQYGNIVVAVQYRLGIMGFMNSFNVSANSVITFSRIF